MKIIETVKRIHYNMNNVSFLALSVSFMSDLMNGLIHNTMSLPLQILDIIMFVITFVFSIACIKTIMTPVKKEKEEETSCVETQYPAQPVNPQYDLNVIMRENKVNS